MVLFSQSVHKMLFNLIFVRVWDSVLLYFSLCLKYDSDLFQCVRDILLSIISVCARNIVWFLFQSVHEILLHFSSVCTWDIVHLYFSLCMEYCSALFQFVHEILFNLFFILDVTFIIFLFAREVQFLFISVHNWNVVQSHFSLCMKYFLSPFQSMHKALFMWFHSCNETPFSSLVWVFFISSFFPSIYMKHSAVFLYLHETLFSLISSLAWNA